MHKHYKHPVSVILMMLIIFSFLRAFKKEQKQEVSESCKTVTANTLCRQHYRNNQEFTHWSRHTQVDRSTEIFKMAATHQEKHIAGWNFTLNTCITILRFTSVKFCRHLELSIQDGYMIFYMSGGNLDCFKLAKFVNSTPS